MSEALPPMTTIRLPAPLEAWVRDEAAERRWSVAGLFAGAMAEACRSGHAVSRVGLFGEDEIRDLQRAWRLRGGPEQAAATLRTFGYRMRRS